MYLILSNSIIFAKYKLSFSLFEKKKIVVYISDVTKTDSIHEPIELEDVVALFVLAKKCCLMYVPTKDQTGRRFRAIIRVIISLAANNGTGLRCRKALYSTTIMSSK